MTEKLRLDLQILLPHVPDKADACVGRLIRELRTQTRALTPSPFARKAS